jgi:hypothetical protein
MAGYFSSIARSLTSKSSIAASHFAIFFEFWCVIGGVGLQTIRDWVLHCQAISLPPPANIAGFRVS